MAFDLNTSLLQQLAASEFSGDTLEFGRTVLSCIIHAAFCRKHSLTPCQFEYCANYRAWQDHVRQHTIPHMQCEIQGAHAQCRVVFAVFAHSVKCTSTSCLLCNGLDLSKVNVPQEFLLQFKSSVGGPPRSRAVSQPAPMMHSQMMLSSALAGIPMAGMPTVPPMQGMMFDQSTGAFYPMIPMMYHQAVQAPTGALSPIPSPQLGTPSTPGGSGGGGGPHTLGVPPNSSAAARRSHSNSAPIPYIPRTKAS